MIQISPIKQKYYFSVDCTQFSEEIQDIISQYAYDSERMINYADGDFNVPISVSDLENLLKSSSEEYDEECETEEERHENPYRHLTNDLPIELTSDPNQPFLVEFFQ